MEGSITPSSLRTRPAKPGDVPALFRMKQQLSRDEGNEGVLRATERDWLRDGFGPDARFRCFLAEQAGVPVGMVTYSEQYVTALGGTIFSVQDLYIEPAQRRHGAGRLLLARVAAVAAERGIPLIELTMLEGNPAGAFYRRLGFRHLPECLTYAIGGQPMLELALPLAAAPALPR